MTKITRPDVDVQAFASEQNVNERTVFDSTEITDDLTVNLNDSFKRGWGVVGASGLPTIQDFNGAMFTISQLTTYLYQNGIAEYSPNQTYYTGSIVNQGGTLHQSLTDNNKNNDLQDPTHWKKLIELSSSVTSESEQTAATSKAVKTAYDFAAEKLSASGGTIIGDLNVTGKLQQAGSDVVTTDSIVKSIPNYSSPTAISSTQGAQFTAPSDGVIYIYGIIDRGATQILSLKIGTADVYRLNKNNQSTGIGLSSFITIGKGDILIVDKNSATLATLIFYPFK